MKSLLTTRPPITKRYSQKKWRNNALTNPASAFEGQRSTLEVPKAYIPIFRFSHFNRMQSETMDKASFYSGENVVISALTEASETTLLELAMIWCLSSQQQAAVKMVYLAPTKSLCAEKVKAWTHSFGPWGIKCQEFTGDSDYATKNAIKNMDIIVTTFEKWDSMTRRGTNHGQLNRRIKFIMVSKENSALEAATDIVFVFLCMY
ncbi:hypothetical protein [Absidia glauca]|uniref:Helicase ATP-binding domain-containing protein n=1 Tax=Absidia glauca TaxID=4829 RepID=A0A168PDH0_ABSGL|nr:hypothetical protein [Absidia glauca]